MTEPQNTLMNKDPKDTNPMVSPVNKTAETKPLATNLPKKRPPKTKLAKKELARKKPSEKAQPDSTVDVPNTPHPVFIDVNERCLISAEQLKRYTDTNELPSDTRTAPDLDVGFGQQRALKALHTALDIHASGYHVFAAGENGLGKRTVISRLLQRIAADAPTPDDWVYVYNFADPRTPQALRLPSGQATILQQQVNQLWQQAKKRLSQRFRSDQYQSKIEAIKNDTHQKESQAYDDLNTEGKQYDLALTFRAFDNKAVFVHPSQLPKEESNSEVKDDKISNSQKNKSIKEEGQRASIPNDNISSADDSVSKDANHDYGKSEYEAELNNFAQKNHMQKRLSQLTIALEQLEDEANDAIEALHRNIARRALQPLFAPIYEQFTDHPLVVEYLKTVFADMVTHVERIVNGDDEEFVTAVLATTPSRYAVNVIVSHAPDSGAPVIFEDLPTHLNLLGHVEQITQLGTVTTDVSMIRAGALHRANGGYLLLEASHLLEHPYAWQGLKRALQSRKIKLSSL